MPLKFTFKALFAMVLVEEENRVDQDLRPLSCAVGIVPPGAARKRLIGLPAESGIDELINRDKDIFKVRPHSFTSSR